ncbi:MAG TPA: hypothetical protein DDX91_03335, partial [Ruminococcaceae bacterium]|nr:hypothetical protein [Oscillospiraceae bacterium]
MGGNNMKISVIIPICNSEKYLPQCLDSVLCQNIDDMEIICVDDCSSDSSPDILEAYSKKDSRLTVIRSGTNLHAGVCRNIGLEKAKGEYVLFLDADDMLFKGAPEKLVKTAERYNADIVRCRAEDFDDVTGQSSISPHNSLKKVPPFLFDRAISYKSLYPVFSKICVAPWGGLFKRSFLIDNKIRFNSLVCVNDRSFFWESVLKAGTIVFSKVFLVHYRTNINTSLVGRRIKNFSCHFKSYELVYKASGALPPKMRRSILDAEMFDMAHWLEQSAGTEYFAQTVEMMSEFLNNMDKTVWNNIGRCVWYKRIAPL